MTDKKILALKPNRFSPIEYGAGRTVWRAVVETRYIGENGKPKKISLNDVIEPSFWGNVCEKLSNAGYLAHIEVIDDDFTWYAELIVKEVGPTYLNVEVLNHVEFSKNKNDFNARFDDYGIEVKFKGPALKWCVINKKTGVVVMDKIDNKKKAESVASNHIKALSL